MVYWYRYRHDLWKRVEIADNTQKSSKERPEWTAEEKAERNVRRAQMAIEGYALCNDWDWFGTFTLDPKFHDRKDLDLFRYQFVRFIGNQSRGSSSRISFLLVPELHKNLEGWHMHGLLSGIDKDDLRPFTLSERLPRYIRNCLIQDRQIYDWTKYRDRFGFNDIEAVRNRDAASRYITKYIRKDQDQTAAALDLGKHLYYVSRGLKRPQRVECENASGLPPETFPFGMIAGNRYDFEYGSVQWYQSPE